VEDNFLTQLVGEPTRQGAPPNLWFTNREELVGDVMVGGRLGYSNHEIIVFNCRRNKEGRLTELPPWSSTGQTLACLEAWLTESLGRQSWGAKDSRKAGHSSRSLKGARASCPRAERHDNGE